MNTITSPLGMFQKSFHLQKNNVYIYLPLRIQVNRNKILIVKDVKDLGRKSQQKSAKEENLGV